MLTIGELARRAGVRTSALRYYEKEGLLEPADRTEAGYRLYMPEDEQTLRFIQRAQRLGFSLADIRELLPGQGGGAARIVEIAEARLVELERQLTEQLVRRHEMALFVQDLRQEMDGANDSIEPLFDRLLDRVCARPTDRSTAHLTLQWLFDRTGCVLGSVNEETVLNALVGRHVHIWSEDDAYHILVVGHDPEVEAALQELARLEADCHAHPTPRLVTNDEGYLLTAEGSNAFLFAQLFLSFEGENGVME